MVGRCYAIIVPEIVRGVRSLIPGRGPVTWRIRRTFASFFPSFLFPLLPYERSLARSGGESLGETRLSPLGAGRRYSER